MSTRSAWLDAAREGLWSRREFSFIPDRDLPPPPGTVSPGDGPRVAFAGFPSDYSLGFLLRLLELEVRPVGLITSPGAHPAILGDNALSRIAEHLGIPLIRAWRVNDEHSRFAIAELDADAVVMASFDQIIGAGTLELARHGWLNVHPSLLPAYRGPEPVYWAIAEGAAESGITLHRAVPRVDAGPALAQARLELAPEETSGTLTRRLVAAGAELLPVALDGLLADAPGTPLDLSRGTYRGAVGHTPLNAAGSAAEAERLVRAGVPNMLAWARWNSHRGYVRRARLGPAGPAEAALRFPDADLVLVETAERCGCHHDVPDCPHRRAREAAAG